MLNIISLVATNKHTSLVSGLEPSFGAPMVGDGSDVCEGEGEGFARGKVIGINNFGYHWISGGIAQNPAGFERDKTSETERNSLPPERLINFLLAKHTRTANDVPI